MQYVSLGFMIILLQIFSLQCEHNRLRGDAELLHRPAPAEGGLAHRQRRRARVLFHNPNPQVKIFALLHTYFGG